MTTLSSGYDPQAVRSNFLPYALAVLNGQTIYALDYFSPTYIKAKKSLVSIGKLKYDGQVHMPNLSNRFYGNTSSYWAILMHNGYTHEQEIGSNTIINIPNPASLDSNASVILNNRLIKTVVV